VDDPPDRPYSRSPEVEDLVALCAALNREGAKYVLIGGFAVILHGWVRATKDIDLLVETSEENFLAVQRALATLPDNAVAELEADELLRYPVVRVADEIVVDLMAAACGIGYDEAISVGVETEEIEGVQIPIAGKELLIRMKDTVRGSDAADIRFLRMKQEEESAT
jgi:hypothetical protein